MKFLMPTLVYSEENCVLRHSAELASLGSRALIVTGKNSARRCGAFADVTLPSTNTAYPGWNSRKWRKTLLWKQS